MPILINGTPNGTTDISHIEQIDWYYEDCVIGGPGSFVVPITDRENLNEAIRTKLALEVAGLTPKRSTVPSVDKEPRVLCTIGEKLWQERWNTIVPASKDTSSPPIKDASSLDKQMSKDDAMLNKKIKGICRGC